MLLINSIPVIYPQMIIIQEKQVINTYKFITIRYANTAHKWSDAPWRAHDRSFPADVCLSDRSLKHAARTTPLEAHHKRGITSSRRHMGGAGGRGDS